MAILNVGVQESDIKSLSSDLPHYKKIQSKFGKFWGTTCLKLTLDLHPVHSQASWRYPCFL